MTTKITKTEVQEVIEHFGDKTISKGCIGRTKTGLLVELVRELKNSYEDADCRRINKMTIEKILGHPILIGDVLEKTGGTGGTVYQDQDDKILELYYKWDDCGVSKSLQQILEKAEWETAPMLPTLKLNKKSPLDSTVEIKQVLKSPAAELFSFLHSLIPTK